METNYINYLNYFDKKDYQLLFTSLNEHLEKMKAEDNLQYSSFIADFSVIISKMQSSPSENYQSFMIEFEKFLPHLEHIDPFQYFDTNQTKFLSSLAENYDAKNLYHYLVSFHPSLIDALSSLDVPKKKEFVQMYLDNVGIHCPEKLDVLFAQPHHDKYQSLINVIQKDDELMNLAYSKKLTLNWSTFNLDANEGVSIPKCKIIIASDPKLTHSQFMNFFKENNEKPTWVNRLSMMHNILYECRDLFSKEQQEEHKQAFHTFFNLVCSDKITGIFRDCDLAKSYKIAFRLAREYFNSDLSSVNFGKIPLFHHLMDHMFTPYKTHYDPKTGKECNRNETSAFSVKKVYYDAHFLNALYGYLAYNKKVPLPNLVNSKGISISPFEALMVDFTNMKDSYLKMTDGKVVVPVNNFDFLIKALVENNTSFFTQNNASLYSSISILTSKADREYVRNFINHNLEQLKESPINWLTENKVQKTTDKNTSAFKKLFSFWGKKELKENVTTDASNTTLENNANIDSDYQKMNSVLEASTIDEKVKIQVQEFFKNSSAILILCEQLPNQFIEEKINIEKMNHKYIFDIVNNYEEGIKIIQNKEKFTESTLSQISILNEEIASISERVQKAIDNNVQQKSDELEQFLQKRYKSNSL